MDSFGRVIEILITILLLFIVPVQYIAINQDAVCQTYVTTETSYLVDSVRNIGYLNKEMYETYLRKLNCTNQIYQIEMIHYRYLLEADGDSYKGHYYSTSQEDILSELYEDYEDADYKFHMGDYFMIKVKNKSKTYGGRIQEFFLRRKLPADQIYVVYGGAVRDEIY